MPRRAASSPSAITGLLDGLRLESEGVSNQFDSLGQFVEPLAYTLRPTSSIVKPARIVPRGVSVLGFSQLADPRLLHSATDLGGFSFCIWSDQHLALLRRVPGRLARIRFGQSVVSLSQARSPEIGVRAVRHIAGSMAGFLTRNLRMCPAIQTASPP
jgi:hypothetical protein